MIYLQNINLIDEVPSSNYLQFHHFVRQFVSTLYSDLIVFQVYFLKQSTQMRLSKWFTAKIFLLSHRGRVHKVIFRAAGNRWWFGRFMQLKRALTNYSRMAIEPFIRVQQEMLHWDNIFISSSAH
jgi:hypothetical protein